MRKIVVGEQEFHYQVGRSYINIRLPDGSRVTPSLPEVTGLSWDEVERGQWKRWFSVTPANIREYIENHLLGQKGT